MLFYYLLYYSWDNISNVQNSIDILLGSENKQLFSENWSPFVFFFF